MRRFTFAGLCALLLLAFLALTPAHASVVYTASGSPVTGITDSAKATITLGSGTITVTLDELSQYTGQSDVGLLSGISFVVGPSISSTTLSSYTYSGLASLSSSGTVTSATESATHWGTTVSGGSVYLATVGTGAAGGQPGDLIIGPNSSGNFSSSYGSVAKSVTNHLPVVLGEATFVISAPGVTSATTLSDVVFNFGTTSGQTLTGVLTPTSAPEPASALVVASGLLGMGLFARRKTVAR
jgi:hypothetical protein